MAAGDVNSEILRKQLMVNQMVNAVGCTPEQATTILQQAQWHSDAALSLFFNENAILPQVSAAPPVHPGPGRSSSGTSAGSAHSLGMRVASYAVPTNTPATPPQLMETLQQFERMNTSSPSGGGEFFEPAIVKCRTKAGER
ncbi:UBA-like domain-containing protein 2-B [Geodia barretti]|jgi:hypothetical protein|uniref:UBA-like domain-containing protein 2-B n=1 Tax=Geodia barretti TaxID=519541 RepID=A0AA35WJL5_GEOBA|nr:UBA-like domain-containing protein 2-B [Geodia barretti]